MTDTEDSLPQGGAEADAAEYVLGLMPAEEAAAFEARLAVNADLQQDVAAWIAYFATFTDPIPEKAPPPQVLRRLEARVFGKTPSRKLWPQVGPYVVGAVVGASVAWLVFASGALSPQRPALFAELTAPDVPFEVTVRYDPELNALRVLLSEDTLGNDEVLELWLIQNDARPVSLAILRGAETLVALPPAVLDQLNGATVMVSREPSGGAVDGSPSTEFRVEGVLRPE